MTGYCVHYLVQDEERGESPILLQFYCGSKNRGNKEGRVMIKGYCNLFWLLKKGEEDEIFQLSQGPLLLSIFI